MLRPAQGVRGAAGRWASGRAVGARDTRGARQERQVRVRGRRTLSRRAEAARRASGARRQRAAGALAGTAWARSWAHGERGARQALAWPGRWMGAQAGPGGPVLVRCAPGSVLARFLDPVRLGIFLSHQMNTVHCKINF